MSTKHIFFFSLIFFALIYSCAKDPCESVVCNNGKALQDGYECFCLCDKGWFGENCDREDPCQTKSINCFNGGTCLNGACLCDVGFAGDSCEIILRDYFIGNYTAQLNCPPNSPINLSFSIQAPDSLVENSTDLVIYNLNNQAYILEAYVNDEGNVQIPNQSIATESIKGIVTRSNDGFTINYEIRDVNGSQFCEIYIVK